MSIVVLMKCVKCKRPNENLGFFLSEESAIEFAKKYAEDRAEDLKIAERAVFVFSEDKLYHVWSSVDPETSYGC